MQFVYFPIKARGFHVCGACWHGIFPHPNSVEEATKSLCLISRNVEFLLIISGSKIRTHFRKFTLVLPALAHILYYYMDKGILLGTKTLVLIIRHYIRELSGVFSVCHA